MRIKLLKDFEIALKNYVKAILFKVVLQYIESVDFMTEVVKLVRKIDKTYDTPSMEDSDEYGHSYWDAWCNNIIPYIEENFSTQNIRDGIKCAIKYGVTDEDEVIIKRSLLFEDSEGKERNIIEYLFRF
jgi:hypothetical protein